MALVFLEIIENKEKYQIYVLKKYCEDKYVDLLLKGKEGKRHYVIVKKINTFMDDYTLHRAKSQFLCLLFPNF